MLRNYFNEYKIDITETFKLSLPIIFGRLGAVLMGVLDSVMVGKVGYIDLAAAGISNSIFIMIGIIPIGFLIVGSPMISAAFSRNDKQECVNLMKGCIQTSVLMSLFFGVIMLVFAWNFQWFNQPKEVEVLAVPYFYLIIASTLPLMVFIAIEQFTDGLENTSVSMFFNVTGLIVNAGINWVLIYGNWGFPKLGLFGAGIGTLVARIYMMIGIWVVVKNQNAFKSFDLNLNLFKVHKETFIRIVKYGAPSGMQFFFEVSAFSFAAVMIGWLGTVPLAAHNLAISIASITYMLSSGFATGGSIRVASAFGVKNKEGIMKAARSAMFFVIFLMSVSCFSFIVFNEFFARLYTSEPKVIEVASILIIIGGIFQLGDGIQVVSIRALLAIEDINFPTIITLSAYWLIGVPIGSLLCFYFDYGVYGMWVGLLIGLWLSAILLTIRFLNRAKKV
jgi:MATE family multidrug resistance protein